MAVLGPHVFDRVPLIKAAADAGVPLRTAERWLAAYTADGSTARSGRSDRTRRRRIPVELVGLIEGMAWRRPPPKVAQVHREAPGSPPSGAGRRRRTRSSTASSPTLTAAWCRWRTEAVNWRFIWFWLKFREADGLPIAANIDTRSGDERSRSLVWRDDGSWQVGGARTRMVMAWRHGC